MNNKNLTYISVYSRPFAVKSFICLNLVFFSVNLCQSAVSADRNRVNQKNKNMSNEPNFAKRTSSIKYPESRIEQKMSNEPNLQGGQITYLINEQQTMNYKQLSNEPNFIHQINVTSVMTKYYNNEKQTISALPALPDLIVIEGSKGEGSSAKGNNELLSNEPNSNPFSPATTWRGCLAPTPAVGVFCLTFERKAENKKMSNEPNFRPFTHFINEQRTMNNEHFSNEPNLQQI